MLDIGIPYVPLHWHYWLGAGSIFITNILIGFNPELHHNNKHVYFWIPLLVAGFLYMAISIIRYLLNI